MPLVSQYDRYEDNDTRSTASAALYHQERIWLETIDGLGILKGRDNEDWYSIYVQPGTESLIIDIQSPHSDINTTSDLNLVLWNTNDFVLLERIP